MQNNFAENLKQLRLERNYSMQALADLANVSKSMISKIERNEVQPTLDVAMRLATGLGKTLSELLHGQVSGQVAHIQSSQKPVWQDAKSKLKRTLISPAFSGSKLEWVHVELPVNASTGILPEMANNGEKFLYVVKGEIRAKIGNEMFNVKAGDSLYLVANRPHEFKNVGKKMAEYFVICLFN